MVAGTNKGSNAPGGSRGRRVDRARPVPGPSSDPYTNLIMANIAMQIAAYVLRRSVERRILKGRYGKDTAREIIRNRPISQTLVTAAVARLATGSIPGAALVSTGMAVKLLLDRSKARRLARDVGDRALIEQARGE